MKMKMKTKIKRTVSESARGRILRLCYSAASTAALLLSLQTLAAVEDHQATGLWGVLFLVVAVSRILAAFLFRSVGDRMMSVYFFASCAITVINAVTIFIFGSSVRILSVVGILFFSTLIAHRVLKIIQNRNLRSGVINGIAILTIMFFGVLFFGKDEEIGALIPILLAFSVAALSLVHIIVISFSQIKMNILLKIMRKTFAAEILFGLLLLIVAFSFVFKVLEPGFNTFGDALWYCFAVVTTIGFGDFTVTSHVSRVLSVILGIYGIIVVALITSIIVNFYNEVKDSDRTENAAKKETASGEENGAVPDESLHEK